MHRVLVPVVRELLRARANVRRALAAPAPPAARESLVPDPAEPRS
jgi:hypothetical protein